jgi:transglutaminase-like putative cysteine protease
MSSPGWRPGPRQAGHGVDATLAALATLTAAWPISTLLAQPTWLGGTVLLLAVIAVAGVGARSLALRGWQVLTVQVVCSVLAAGAIYGRGHLWHGLPTFETVRFANRLILEAVSTAQRFAAPAPTTPGLIFVVGCSLGVVALAVDYLAVTCRTPSLAGLPLLTVFLAAVANQGSTLPFVFFLAAAAMWLVLMARAGGTILRQWGTTVASARTPSPQNLQSRGILEHASMARMLGAGALVAALTVPLVLPQLPPTFLLSGLGRSSGQIGNGSNTVGFSQSIDLATDLGNRSRAPVLQYTTADASPPPLRVALGSAYRPEPGVWLPYGRPWRSSSGTTGLSGNPRVPEPTGLSPDVPQRTFALDVRRNLLEDPYLAVPYPLTGADLAGVAWGADESTQSVRVAQRPDTYTVSYLRLEPSVTMLRNAAQLSERDRQPFDLDLRLEGPYVESVTALTERLTSGKSSVYDKAMAIQQYLRADGGFSYSLTLAPAAKDQLGNTVGDSLTNFLVTKQGYCVQFATAMVMMSRAAGIPARMALGFLPGTKSRGVWTVIAADAHAWPELYLDGVGWTRFEPTPSRGATPPYATPATSTGTTPDGSSPNATTAPAPGSNPRRDLSGGPAGVGASAGAGLSPRSAIQWLTHGWGPVLLGVLVALLGSLVVPLAAVWRRRRSLSTAATPAQRVEVEWELLTSSLGDLGIAPEPSRTPRQLQAHYARQASLEDEDSQALARVVLTLERSRYGVFPPVVDRLSADARQVVRAAAANRRGSDRLRAALWPASGITQLRSATAETAHEARRRVRAVSDLARRLRPRRREA